MSFIVDFIRRYHPVHLSHVHADTHLRDSRTSKLGVSPVLCISISLPFSLSSISVSVFFSLYFCSHKDVEFRFISQGRKIPLQYTVRSIYMYGVKILSRCRLQSWFRMKLEVFFSASQSERRCVHCDIPSFTQSMLPARTGVAGSQAHHQARFYLPEWPYINVFI